MVRGLPHAADYGGGNRCRAGSHEPDRARGSRPNDHGRLWSVDLPHPFDHSIHEETGAAVTEALVPRWNYVEGSSLRRPPQVIRDVRRVDVFIHDSLHTARTSIRDGLRGCCEPQGGVMLVDDISTHDGFVTFTRDHAEFRAIVARRPTGRAIGVAVKTSDG